MYFPNFETDSISLLGGRLQQIPGLAQALVIEQGQPNIQVIADLENTVMDQSATPQQIDCYTKAVGIRRKATFALHIALLGQLDSMCLVEAIPKLEADIDDFDELGDAMVDAWSNPLENRLNTIAETNPWQDVFDAYDFLAIGGPKTRSRQEQVAIRHSRLREEPKQLAKSIEGLTRKIESSDLPEGVSPLMVLRHSLRVLRSQANLSVISSSAITEDIQAGDPHNVLEVRKVGKNHSLAYTMPVRDCPVGNEGGVRELEREVFESELIPIFGCPAMRTGLVVKLYDRTAEEAISRQFVRSLVAS